MTIFCSECGHEAVFRDSDERMTPCIEDGFFECTNPECSNSHITDGTHEGNRLNGFFEV
jgi:hypothetical protein